MPRRVVHRVTYQELVIPRTFRSEEPAVCSNCRFLTAKAVRNDKCKGMKAKPESKVMDRSPHIESQSRRLTPGA